MARRVRNDSKLTSSERPFKVQVPEEQLLLLRKKLELAVFPDELEGADWNYGVPLADVKRLAARWQDGFDWRVQEADINESLPQFVQDIEVTGHGMLNIHYVHQKSQLVDAIPLLFVHGWPGSFLEVQKILPLLTDVSPDGHFPSFHVVAFSLPGYGFSEAPKKPGFKMEHYAEIGNKLMISLGYPEYVTQGGDWGSHITREIALMLNDPPALSSHSLLAYLRYLITPYSESEKAGLARSAWFRKKGAGYLAEQSTQPQTLGYSLGDSPVGLLAWIYEKLVSWSDGYAWDDDEVLTWVSIYWFSRAGPAASVRIYYEIAQSNWKSTALTTRVSIPCGVSRFPKELGIVPKSWLYLLGNVVFHAEHTKGGHFAAHERSEDLVDDLRTMFGRDGKAFGVVPGKIGYM
ncbi:hypothetical protein D9758_005040 [Tetrapyrgos nigripes]|uniref:Epoxide hydrolase N-terminal domain-containing protein n=1 Tax=Tetrapyrgos nigripes TaxID=182062 RepID=A0A8H5GW61_9AGAR|nr:hypothetical protein D9758_005040 [Tetrapyrgos nigripes]